MADYTDVWKRVKDSVLTPVKRKNVKSLRRMIRRDGSGIRADTDLVASALFSRIQTLIGGID